MRGQFNKISTFVIAAAAAERDEGEDFVDAFETVRDMEEAELMSLALEQQAAATSPLNEVRRRLTAISQAMAKVRLKKVGSSW